MTEGSYLRNSWRPSFQDIWLAGSESGSAGPLGTTSNRFVDNSARANAPKMCCIEKQSSLWSRLGSKWQISNLRCSDSASVFLSPGLWSLPVLSFWCLALQARKRPQEGRLSNKQKSVAWTGRGVDLTSPVWGHILAFWSASPGPVSYSPGLSSRPVETPLEPANAHRMLRNKSRADVRRKTAYAESRSTITVTT